MHSMAALVAASGDLGGQSVQRNIETTATVKTPDGVGHSPGYHTRTVASSDYLPRGEKTAPSAIPERRPGSALLSSSGIRRKEGRLRPPNATTRRAQSR